MKPGDVIAWKRSFSENEIRLFAKLSGDEGIHHIHADKAGRLMTQGLFTATFPTKIGGDLNFIARDMRFQFLRPVYAGDAIECQVTITGVHEKKGITHVSSKWVCRNQLGREVMNGDAAGIIRQ
jgi:3-hydroxybutyryl-CoA dehydratase